MNNTKQDGSAEGAVGSHLQRVVPPPEPVRAEDAISRSKRILELVDTYANRPDRTNRTALRVALMNEFEGARAQGRDDFGPAERLILRAALADYAENKRVPGERRARARAMWQVLCTE